MSHSAVFLDMSVLFIGKKTEMCSLTQTESFGRNVVPLIKKPITKQVDQQAVTPLVETALPITGECFCLVITPAGPKCNRGDSESQ